MKLSPRSLQITLAALLTTSLLTGTVLTAALLVSACVARAAPPAMDRVQADLPIAPAPAKSTDEQHPTSAPAPQPRPLPVLDREPQLRVLLARGEALSVQLLRPALLPEGGSIGPGTISLLRRGDGMQVTGLARPVTDWLVLRFPPAPEPSFALVDAGRRLFGGDLALRVHGQELVLCEEIGMEAYLVGVLAREVEPDWPLEALKAQAVAARSYATAMWSERQDRPWHLDADHVVDMAYAGYLAQPHPRLATAIAQTRGDLLLVAGQPLTAFFHAASGGVSEDIAAVWPARRLPDGVTPFGDAFARGPDIWAEAGERVAPKRLGRWRVALPWSELQEALAKRQLAPPGGLQRLEVIEGSPAGRVRRLRLIGDQGSREISAVALRMAVGPGRLKSTLWTRVVPTPEALVIEGRGFGHGVGLPQASAWAMATAGRQAPEILARYYPGARLARRW